MSTVQETTESRLDLALHGSTKAPQSDHQSWKYKPISPQEQAMIDVANAEYRIKQKEYQELEQRRVKERELEREKI